jgi:hypothetical protein
MLKSVPRRIKSGKEARNILDVGEKVANRVRIINDLTID